MTRKTVSERRIAGANKQIASLTQALHEAREYGEVLAEGIKDKDGLIKHLKGSNNRLRAELSQAERNVTEATAAFNDLSDTSARIIADKGKEVKDKSDKVDYLYRQYSKSRTEIRELKDALFEATKDARSWKRGFFALVVITVIAQVVNYAFG